MEFKKKMLSEYATKMNEILSEYKSEYQNIIKDTPAIPDILALNPTLCSTSLSESKETNKENIENTIVQEEYQKDGISFIIGNDTDIKDDSAIKENNEKYDYTKFTKQDTSVLINSETNIKENENNQINANTNSNPIVDASLLGNSFNCLNTSINQSFLNSEFRRKAKRRTGRMIVKRKLEMADYLEELCKKRKTDQAENFLVIYSLISKERKENIKYEKEIEILKAKLKETEEISSKKAEQERKDLEKIRIENLEISRKIQKELNDLKEFKETIFKEVKKIEEDKKALQDQQEFSNLKKIQDEKRLFEEEYKRETIRLEAERTIIVEERKKLEEMRQLEASKIQNERIKLEVEKSGEIKKIIEEKQRLEKLLNEQNINLENERRLLKEEREKMNQTFLEITSKMREPAKPKEVKIQLPIGAMAGLENNTILKNEKKGINDLFQTMKKEFHEKISQSRLIKQAKPEPPIQVFTRQMPQKPQAKPDNEKLDAHFLYKRSIDAQLVSNEPKKYVPKTVVPFYANEDEFESEDKKFESALFTKDPKLNYIVKNQDHDEIRNFFGNKKEIDVEHIFSQIENVSNFSPNKLRRNQKSL